MSLGRKVSRLGFISIAAPCVAYILTLLPHLGMKSLAIFYFFAPLTRIAGAAAGVLVGIVACVKAPDWRVARIGFADIALGVVAFIAAVLPALNQKG